MTQYSDNTVLQAIRNGKDKEAVSYFYSDFWPEIKAMILGKGGNYDEAEEIYHQAILKFFERVKKGGYEAGKTSGIRGYIYTICKNLWVDMIKKRNRETEISDKELNQSANPISTESKHFMKELFATLGERCERVLDYFIYHGFSMKDICDKMALESENAAKMQKHRCVKKLISLLKNNPGTEKTVIELLRA